MKANWSRRFLVIFASLLISLLLTACPQQLPPEDDPFGARRVTEIISSETPPTGVIRINEHLTVEFVGKGTLTNEAPDLPEADEAMVPGNDGSAEGPADEAEFGRMAFHVFNPDTGNEFLLTFEQPLLDEVHAFQSARNLTSGTEGVDDPNAVERPIIPQGWSNGTDNRVLRTPTTLWPWRTIAQHGSGDSSCSSTLVGPRHLITAAHCINKRGTNQWYTVRVDPGRNGLNNSPYGSSTISVNPAPGTSAWYFTPAQWRTQWCVDNAYACNQWDWGMIVIPDRLGDLTGWMGYWAGPGGFLEQRTLYNRGYPKCDTSKANKPALCDEETYGQTYWARLFGDTSCRIGSYHYPGPDNWNRVLKVSCDLSAGHSGSPIYFYVQDPNLNNQWVPVVTAVVTWEECYTCNASKNYPNLVRRITPGDLSIISWLRNVFP